MALGERGPFGVDLGACAGPAALGQVEQEGERVELLQFLQGAVAERVEGLDDRDAQLLAKAGRFVAVQLGRLEARHVQDAADVFDGLVHEDPDRLDPLGEVPEDVLGGLDLDLAGGLREDKADVVGTLFSRGHRIRDAGDAADLDSQHGPWILRA